MKTRLRKTAATQSDPINFRHWQELVDDFDSRIQSAANQETEEAVVDLWLEDPRSFMNGLEDNEEQHPLVRRVKTGGTGLHRYDSAQKVAATSSWDREFSDAQVHAAQVLKNLGNL